MPATCFTWQCVEETWWHELLESSEGCEQANKKPVFILNIIIYVLF